MTISGWLMLAIVFAGLYWLGLQLNPPEHQTIVPEPNNLLRSEEE